MNADTSLIFIVPLVVMLAGVVFEMVRVAFNKGERDRTALRFRTLGFIGGIRDVMSIQFQHRETTTMRTETTHADTRIDLGEWARPIATATVGMQAKDSTRYVGAAPSIPRLRLQEPAVRAEERVAARSR